MDYLFGQNKLCDKNTENKRIIGNYFDLYNQRQKEFNSDIWKRWKPQDSSEDSKHLMQSNAASPSNFYFAEDFQYLLNEIHARVQNTVADPPDPPELLRLCINSMGSPLWYGEGFSEDLLKFITILKSFVRNTFSCCLITLPTHLFRHLEDGLQLYERLIDKVDFCVALESFAGTDKETDPAFRECDGLLHLVKVSDFYTLASYVPEERTFTFKLHPRKFLLKKLPLPPRESGEDGDARGLKRKSESLQID